MVAEIGSRDLGLDISILYFYLSLSLYLDISLFTVSTFSVYFSMADSMWEEFDGEESIAREAPDLQEMGGLSRFETGSSRNSIASADAFVAVVEQSPLGNYNPVVNHIPVPTLPGNPSPAVPQAQTSQAWAYQNSMPGVPYNSLDVYNLLPEFHQNELILSQHQFREGPPQRPVAEASTVLRLPRNYDIGTPVPTLANFGVASNAVPKAVMPRMPQKPPLRGRLVMVFKVQTHKWGLYRKINQASS